MDTILILDFGSQTTQLIGRRIREIGVYSEIAPGDAKVGPLLKKEVRGVILSGSPASVYDKDAPLVDPNIYELPVPVLGICYGAQRMVQDRGGRVSSLKNKEYGRARIKFLEQSSLFSGLAEGFTSWMSHGDSIELLPGEFRTAAVTENGLPALVVHEQKRIMGLQFHPEVSHCEGGSQILENFALKICGARRQWNMETFLNKARMELQERVGGNKVLLLISGGVDSTVTAALLLKALPADQVHLMYIDTGLMRLNESEEVAETLKGLGASHLYLIDGAERFLAALEGVADPEEKRKIIGDLFIRIQAEESAARGIEGPDRAFLAQGTLYTDMIESGKGVGSRAKVIKSHHNVATPLVERKRAEGLVIEPLSSLYKDEVRNLGAMVGLSPEIIGRHPFPGPGLAVRILGPVTREKCDILRRADAIYIGELKKRGLYNKIWQAFCVLLSSRSVGVSGDVRRYGYVLALRAVVSTDGMTADVFPFAGTELLEISSAITNRVEEIGRVVYDISSKPPATIEWE